MIFVHGEECEISLPKLRLDEARLRLLLVLCLPESHVRLPNKELLDDLATASRDVIIILVVRSISSREVRTALCARYTRRGRSQRARRVRHVTRMTYLLACYRCSLAKANAGPLGAAKIGLS